MSLPWRLRFLTFELFSSKRKTSGMTASVSLLLAKSRSTKFAPTSARAPIKADAPLSDTMLPLRSTLERFLNFCSRIKSARANTESSVRRLWLRSSSRRPCCSFRVPIIAQTDALVSLLLRTRRWRSPVIFSRARARVLAPSSPRLALQSEMVWTLSWYRIPLRRDEMPLSTIGRSSTCSSTTESASPADTKDRIRVSGRSPLFSDSAM
mmetsp:Transcript_9653/g.27077  ORF Transcript_9653/g.27077 Transcript_9653/m.27077 type:complete len:209 (+) Transcript_9653:745-1371(+)